MLAKMKCPEWQVRHVRQMKFLEMKILHVSLDEIRSVASASCKTNEMVRYKNTSCKLK